LAEKLSAPAEVAVAVAVVSWNTCELLRHCLQSCEADVRAGIAEVWVVDNDSDDGSAAMVEREFPWVRLVASPENVGFGPAVNLVAAQTRTPWIAVANADVRLTPGSLQQMLGAGQDHPAAGIVAPRLMLDDGVTQHSVYRFPTLWSATAFSLGLGGVSARLGDWLLLEGRWDPDRPRSVDWAVGAFALVRREAWDAAGGFDPRQWMYAEDLDLGWRASRAGWTTWYEAPAVVHHHRAASTFQRWGHTIDVRMERSTYAWLLRRRGIVVARLYALINVAGAAARAVLVLPQAILDRGDRRLRLWKLRRWARIHLTNLVASRHALEVHR
jgi:N-acetylglucosaminyl-diphospho-decaprenol L-rhamnosyltransferase